MVGILVLGCGHISHIVKIIYSALFLLKSSSLLSGTDQINWWYSNDDLGRVCQNCKFYDSRGCGSYVRTRSFKSWWICIRSYSIVMHDIDCYCINGKWCCYPMSLLIIIHSMIDLLLCLFDSFWQEDSVEFMILRWLIRSVGLLFFLADNWSNNFFLIVVKNVKEDFEKYFNLSPLIENQIYLLNRDKMHTFCKVSIVLLFNSLP